jgi:hypothetical protein
VVVLFKLFAKTEKITMEDSLKATPSDAKTGTVNLDTDFLLV